MKLNVSITGLSKMQKKMIAKANPAAIQKIVRVNAAELTDMALMDSCAGRSRYRLKKTGWQL